MTNKICLLLLIIILGSVFRLYRFADFPVQLNHDEITQLYDAISVAQTGKDIYGNFLPLIFESVHDFKPPFYTYTTALTYFLLGNKEYIIRIPGLLFSIGIIPLVFFFVNKIFRNPKIALLAAFVTAITPFEIFFARKSFENGAGIFFMLLGFSSLLQYLEDKKISRWLYLGIVAISVAMYTYFSHAVIIPLLVFLFGYIFREELITKSYRKLIFPVILGVFLVFPLFLIILLNPGSRYRSTTVFVTQDVLLGERLGDIQKAEVGATVFREKTVIDYIFNRYLEQFSPDYLFLNGLDLTNQGPIGSGPLLLIQIPFVFLGFVFLFRRIEARFRNFVLGWIAIGALPSALTFEPHSPHRIIMVFTMLNIISAAGMYWFLEILLRQRGVRGLIKTGVVCLLAIAFFLNIVYFLHMYFVNFPYEKSQNIHYPFKQAALFAWSKYNDFDQIVFDPLYGQSAPVVGTAAHYYFAYYGNYPPGLLQEEYRIGTKEREVLFDKFSIRKVEWPKDQGLKNTLIIASPWTLPINSINTEKILKTFYFYDGQPAFYAVKLE